MKKSYVFMVCACVFCFNCMARADENSGLVVAIQNAKSACLGISDRMSNMKTMAGINTAVTGVGTVTGAVALGTGIAKANVDAKAEELEQLIKELEKLDTDAPEPTEEEANQFYQEFEASYEEAMIEIKKNKQSLSEMNEKSKQLGNWRTGTMAASTVADTAGTLIALNNKVDDDLQFTIDNCIKSISALETEHMRARVENTASEADLTYADKIVNACLDWRDVDLSSIDKRATGAAISSGAGAVMGLFGTITSAKANSDSVRNDNSDDGKQTEKSLNTASNILAGGTTVASGVATVFNATQISAIKKAVAAADKCEEALR